MSSDARRIAGVVFGFDRATRVAGRFASRRRITTWPSCTSRMICAPYRKPHSRSKPPRPTFADSHNASNMANSSEESRTITRSPS
jgi:hypothetical protein